MNFYTQKWRPGPFEEYTVYTCVFLSHTPKRTAHFLPTPLSLSLYLAISLADP